MTDIITIQPTDILTLGDGSRSPAVVYLSTLATGSRRTMKQALATIADIATSGRVDADVLPWHELRHEHTQAIRTRLAETYAPSTANKMLAALRGVLRAAWKLGMMDSEQYRRAIAVDSVEGSRVAPGRSLNTGELRALFVACAQDTTPAGRRDAALLSVLYGAGVRRSEAVAIDIEDYNADTGQLTIRAGKGNRDRTTYATNGGKSAIDAWLEVRGNESGPMFCRIRRAGKVQSTGLTDQAVYTILCKRAEQAGIEQFSPHDLRRTFVSDLLESGADLALVQQLAGHASPVTTSRYDRRPEHAKRRAAELLHVPFVG